jgi:predicted DNA-binding protein YlxM (UPF0122 family)
MMNDRDYVVMLYDYYSELFNEKQKEYFEQYYFDNLSLAEISENLGVSRNAIHKSIQSMEEKLKFYEDKLRLFYKSNVIRGIMNDIGDNNIRDRLEKLI